MGRHTHTHTHTPLYKAYIQGALSIQYTVHTVHICI